MYLVSKDARGKMFVIHTRRPTSIAHIYCEQDRDTLCQMFNSNSVHRSNYYLSEHNENRHLCKNCVALSDDFEDEFAPNPNLKRGK